VHNILGCRIENATLEAWSRHLVFEREPIFLTDAALEWLEPEMLALTRDEFNQLSGSLGLAFKDAYQTYSVSGDATRVMLFTSEEFHLLSLPARARLMRLQVELRRGQVYPMSFVSGVLTDFPSALGFLESDIFDSDAGRYLALRSDAWWRLSARVRHAWLDHFVSQDRAVCLSGRLSSKLLQGITGKHPSIVAELVGSFASRSGPNCFATTLAAVTGSLNIARSIAGLWLPAESFLRGLSEREFHPRGPLSSARLEPSDVLVWFDQHHRAQHACYALTSEAVLNKDAQAWFAPRQLLPLETVLKTWADDSLDVWVYSRGSSFRTQHAPQKPTAPHADPRDPAA
jgi:hypothetical protein